MLSNCCVSSAFIRKSRCGRISCTADVLSSHSYRHFLTMSMCQSCIGRLRKSSSKPPPTFPNTEAMSEPGYSMPPQAQLRGMEREQLVGGIRKKGSASHWRQIFFHSGSKTHRLERDTGLFMLTCDLHLTAASEPQLQPLRHTNLMNRNKTYLQQDWSDKHHLLPAAGLTDVSRILCWLKRRRKNCTKKWSHSFSISCCTLSEENKAHVRLWASTFGQIQTFKCSEMTPVQINGTATLYKKLKVDGDQQNRVSALLSKLTTTTTQFKSFNQVFHAALL